MCSSNWPILCSFPNQASLVGRKVNPHFLPQIIVRIHPDYLPLFYDNPGRNEFIRLLVHKIPRDKYIRIQ